MTRRPRLQGGWSRGRICASGYMFGHLAELEEPEEPDGPDGPDAPELLDALFVVVAELELDVEPDEDEPLAALAIALPPPAMTPVTASVRSAVFQRAFMLHHLPSSPCVVEQVDRRDV